jgi:hypothetical protein
MRRWPQATFWPQDNTLVIAAVGWAAVRAS